MRARLLYSMIVVIASALILTVSTYAYLSDSETSYDNRIEDGTIELMLKDNNEPWSNGVTGTWVIQDMKPGQEFPCPIEQLDLRNFGTIEASSLNISAKNTTIDPPGPESDSEEGTTDMDSMIEFMCFTYGDGWPIIDLKAYISDVNGNGWLDMDDLENDPILGLTPPDGTGHIQIGFRFRPEADSDYQGDRVETEYSFTLVQ